MNVFRKTQCYRLLLLTCLIGSASSCSVQQIVKDPGTSLLVSFQTIRDLDSEITETSGLETYNNQLLTHNDSDDSATIYFLNTDGTIEGRTTYNRLRNVDWEDMAIGNNHLFIADIGNNYGDRKDLVIYKIPMGNLSDPDIQPETIPLSYQAQKSFERNNQHHSFDGEALVYVNDELLLFSKDWINFTTDVYSIKEASGKQNLQRTEQFEVNGLITGATYNGSNRIVLCGYNSNLEPFVVLLSVDKGSLKLEQRITLPLKDGAQVEAITFFEKIDNSEVYYLTSEAVRIQLGEDEARSDGQLYKLVLKN